MKKLLLAIITMFMVANVFAQSTDHRRPASVGISFFVSDFVTAAEIKKYGLSYSLRNKNLLRSKRFNPGVAVNYVKGITDHIDFNSGLSASWVDYPIPNTAPFSRNNLLLDLAADLHIKLLNDNYFVVPYADLGLGVSKYTSHYAAFAPFGFGLQFNIVDEAFITLNTQYRVPVTSNAASHLVHSLTFYGVLGSKKK
jgi:hypothetical protein